LNVSIIIPTFNRKQSLVRCLKGISRDVEVVVVDDGSSDGTAEAIEQADHPNLKYIRQSNQGPAAARNAGISVASGNYIAFTDDDCVPEGTWPWPLVERIEQEGSKCGGVGGSVRPFNNNLLSRYYTFHRILEPPDSCSYLVTANCLFRRDVLQLVGGFDSRIVHPGGEDAGLSINVRAMGYSLAFEANAVVFHDYRTGLLDFLRTFYRYGKGCACVLG
jgi:glycosyltransferase involved in cell wall biosynthesis